MDEDERFDRIEDIIVEVIAEGMERAPNAAMRASLKSKEKQFVTDVAEIAIRRFWAAIEREDLAARPDAPGARETDTQLAALFERVTALTLQVDRLKAFAEELSWYAPDEDWEDAARRHLKYGDVRPIAEYRAAIANAQNGGEG